jgi:hypothetical protein
MRASTRWAWFAVLVTAFAFHVPEADAHMLKRTKPVKEMTPRQELAHSIRSAHHGKAAVRSARSTIRWFRKHRRWTLHSPDAVTTLEATAAYAEARASLRGHRWLHRTYAPRLREHALARMGPPHKSGWLCIHSREGSWNDTGDPYWGGLQMHPGWGGVHHASDLTPIEQMWLAERVAARHGFAYSWMKGQWPNTFPPCSHHF